MTTPDTDASITNFDSYTNTRKPTTTKTDTSFATAKLTTSKSIAYNVYAYRIIEFLVNTREKNKELILKAWDRNSYI